MKEKGNISLKINRLHQMYFNGLFLFLQITPHCTPAFASMYILGGGVLWSHTQLGPCYALNKGS